MKTSDHRKLEIRLANRTREGWDKAFAEMAANDDDRLLDQVSGTKQVWDQEEWEWPM